jgi:hypothetical protein
MDMATHKKLSYNSDQGQPEGVHALSFRRWTPGPKNNSVLCRSNKKSGWVMEAKKRSVPPKEAVRDVARVPGMDDRQSRNSQIAFLYQHYAFGEAGHDIFVKGRAKETGADEMEIIGPRFSSMIRAA